MYKFVMIYRRVDDEDAVDEFFSSTHLPLAESLPYLLKSEVSRVLSKPGGESRFLLMYELYFASIDTFREAFLTEQGIQLMQALKPWGDAKIITWFYADAFEEDGAGSKGNGEG